MGRNRLFPTRRRPAEPAAPGAQFHTVPGVVDPAAACEIVAPTGLSADDLRTRIGAALMALERER